MSNADHVMERPWFYCEYFHQPRSGCGKAKGWLNDKATKGHQRKYRFEVAFDERGRIDERSGGITISACDADNGRSFSDRVAGGYIREIAGLGKRARPDLRESARRYADATREEYLKRAIG
jgi:hypothetical protein